MIALGGGAWRYRQPLGCGARLDLELESQTALAFEPQRELIPEERPDLQCPGESRGTERYFVDLFEFFLAQFRFL